MYQTQQPGQGLAPASALSSAGQMAQSNRSVDPPPTGHLEIVEKLLIAAISRVDALENRVYTLADRLVGPRPQDPKSAAVAAPPPHQIGRLAEIGNYLHMRLEHVHDEFSRLERL